MKSLVIVFALLLITAISPAFSRNWIPGPAGIYWDNNCDFYGHDLHRKDASEREICLKFCLDEGQCTHFTYFDDTCYLKQSREAFYEDDVNGKSCGFILGRSPQRV